MTITPEVLSGFAGALLAMLFEYVPGLAGWYEPLLPEHKRLIMLGVLIVVSVVIFALSCGGYVSGPECSDSGALGLLWMILVAIGINQGTHLLGKRA